VVELASSITTSTLRSTSVVFQTESDMASVSGACEDSSSSLNLPDDGQSFRSGRSSGTSKVFSWDVPSPIVLAVKYRLSTFLVIKLQTRSGGLKKRTNVWAIGMLKLGDIPDGETLDVGVPSETPRDHEGHRPCADPFMSFYSRLVYSTSDVNEAAMLAVTEREPEAMRRQIGTAFLTLRISPGLGKVRVYEPCRSQWSDGGADLHPITPSPQAHRGLVKSDPRFAAVDEAKQIVAEVMREGESAKATATTGVRHDRAGSLSSHFSLESAARDRSSVHRSPAKSPSGAIAGSPSMDSLQSNNGPRWNEEDDRSSFSADEDSVVEDNDEYYRNRERDPKLFVRELGSPQLALPAR
jgi:hypothetical protein